MLVAVQSRRLLSFGVRIRHHSDFIDSALIKPESHNTAVIRPFSGQAQNSIGLQY